jgi:hypothetical protein
MRWRSDLVDPLGCADLGDLRDNTVATIPPMKRKRTDVRLTLIDLTAERNRYVVAL